MSEYDSSLRTGLIAINLNDGDELVRGHPDERRRRHPHGVAQRHDDPVLRDRRARDGPGDRRRAGHEAQERRGRGRELRRRPRRRRDAVRELERPREAHQARRTSTVRAGRPGRAGHEDHRVPGCGGGRVHRGARR